MHKNDPILVCVDVEAAGPEPITGHLTQFGATALTADRRGLAGCFEGMLIETTPDPEIPAIPVIGPDSVHYDAAEVFSKFNAWLDSLGPGRKVWTNDNPAYDWNFLRCGYAQAGMTEAWPFGFSARRIGDYFAGAQGKFGDSTSWKQLGYVQHTHRAVEDSLAMSVALCRLLEAERGLQGKPRNSGDFLKAAKAVDPKPFLEGLQFAWAGRTTTEPLNLPQ